MYIMYARGRIQKRTAAPHKLQAPNSAPTILLTGMCVCSNLCSTRAAVRVPLRVFAPVGRTQAELTWIIDERSRSNTSLRAMAGVFDSMVLARTTQGSAAGVWRSPLRTTGIVTQSAPAGNLRHTALMAIVNVTFVGFTYASGSAALEACGKCAFGTGGASTSVAKLRFVQEGMPLLSRWSWPHQVCGCNVRCAYVYANTWNVQASAARFA